nr:unnamed protein product [Digitaria exilis]
MQHGGVQAPSSRRWRQHLQLDAAACRLPATARPPLLGVYAGTVHCHCATTALPVRYVPAPPPCARASAW